MLQLFGLTLPESPRPADREVAVALAERMAAASTTLRDGAPAALSAAVRQDARRYLTARRRGELRFAGGAARTCDENAWTLMRLTVDAPPARGATERLVA